MPNPSLLAAHITIALALTITVGVQSAELARFRSDGPKPRAVRTLSTAMWATPVLALLTFVTGGAVLGDGGRGGPWVSAGVLSTLLIGLASVWVQRRLRHRDPSRMGFVGGVQWGVPAMTLAAAFLMADRPQSPAVAAAPVILALVLTVFAYRAAARSTTVRAEIG
jgi:drug/metabolite transporter (DMT)-like permease